MVMKMVHIMEITMAARTIQSVLSVFVIGCRAVGG